MNGKVPKVCVGGLVVRGDEKLTMGVCGVRRISAHDPCLS